MSDILIQLIGLGATAVYIVGNLSGRLDGIEKRLSALEVKKDG